MDLQNSLQKLVREFDAYLDIRFNTIIMVVLFGELFGSWGYFIGFHNLTVGLAQAQLWLCRFSFWARYISSTAA